MVGRTENRHKDGSRRVAGIRQVVAAQAVLFAVLLAGCGGEEAAGVRTTPVKEWNYSTYSIEGLTNWTTGYGAEVGVVLLERSGQPNRLDGIDLASGEVLWMREVPDGLALRTVSSEFAVLASDIPMLVDGRNGEDVLFVELSSGETLFAGGLPGEVAPLWGRDLHVDTDPFVLTALDNEVRRIDASGSVMWEHSAPQSISRVELHGQTLIATLQDRGSTYERPIDLESGDLPHWFTSEDGTAEYRTAGDVITRHNSQDGTVERLDSSGAVMWSVPATDLEVAVDVAGEAVLLAVNDGPGSAQVRRLDPDTGTEVWAQVIGIDTGPSIALVTSDAFVANREIRSLEDGEMLAELAQHAFFYTDGHVIYGLDHGGLVSGYDGQDGPLWNVAGGGKYIEPAPGLVTRYDGGLFGWRP